MHKILDILKMGMLKNRKICLITIRQATLQSTIENIPFKHRNLVHKTKIGLKIHKIFSQI